VKQSSADSMRKEVVIVVSDKLGSRCSREMVSVKTPCKKSSTKAPLWTPLRTELTDIWKRCECLHFNCHGKFNALNPIDSCLVLAKKKELRLRDVFRLRLPRCELVTLAACETGLVDFSNSSDEYMGLPSGFLFAGSSHVVSSLWSVFNASTTYVMVKFYNILHCNKGMSISEALWKAQQWYRRHGTRNNLVSLVGELNVQVLESNWRDMGGSSLSYRAYREKYSHPVHWASFTCVG